MLFSPISRRAATNYLALALAALPLLCTVPGAAALPAFMGANGADAHMLVAQNDDIGEARAADIAESASGGRVLGVEWVETNPAYYAVKVLLEDGVVKTIKVAAQSGKVME